MHLPNQNEPYGLVSYAIPLPVKGSQIKPCLGQIPSGHLETTTFKLQIWLNTERNFLQLKKLNVFSLKKDFSFEVLNNVKQFPSVFHLTVKHKFTGWTRLIQICQKEIRLN